MGSENDPSKVVKKTRLEITLERLQLGMVVKTRLLA